VSFSREATSVKLKNGTNIEPETSNEPRKVIGVVALLSRVFRLRNFKAAWIGGLLGVLLTVGTGLVLNWGGGGPFARLSYDFPFVWERGIPAEVVMVYIDAGVKRNLEQPTDQPLDRRFHAKLLDRLREAGTKLVLYDLLLDTPSANEKADQEFAAAIRAHGRVVLVANYEKAFQANSVSQVEVPPIPILREAAAGFGLATVAPDAMADSKNRTETEGRYIRRFDPGTDSLPSASWVAASLLDVPITKEPGRRRELRWLHYYCAPIEFLTINFDSALSDDETTRKYFHDKIVVVGVADNPDDTFRTPHSRFGSGLFFQGPTAPGAAIHATSLLNLVRGDWLTRLSLKKEMGIFIAWGLFASISLMLLRPWFAIGAAILMATLFTVFAMWLPFQQHVWFAWTIPVMVQTPIALIWGVGYQYIVEARKSRQIRRAFSFYLSPYMADRIANRDFDLSLGGKEVEATVMFTDLAGFTTMSEPLSPTEVSRMLTSYFTRTSKAIIDLDGTLIKYLGDGVMAGWGAPLPDPLHAQHTVLAALTIIRAGKEERNGQMLASTQSTPAVGKRVRWFFKFLTRRTAEQQVIEPETQSAQLGPALRTRIGINTGIFLAGNLGSDVRFDYTLFGDATNFASRLEGLNKYLGTDILISEETFRQLKYGIQTRPVGRFLVVGKGKPAAVYEVLGRTAEFQPAPPWFETFARGLEHFAKRELDAAEKLFRQTKELRHGKDGPSDFYLQRIDRERAKPDTSVWDGTVKLEGK
jgi:adenylate cyclase